MRAEFWKTSRSSPVSDVGRVQCLVNAAGKRESRVTAVIGSGSVSG